MKLTQLMYLVLLIAIFGVGYLYSRVQTLEAQLKNGGGQIAGAQAQAQGSDTTQPAPPAKVDVANGHFPVLGNPNAKVTIVEFSDLQCPFCRSYYNTSFKQIKKEYVDTGKVKVYFRHYPLPFHPMAEPSALAAECANEQGKFWEYHDKVFDEEDKKDPSGGTVQYTNDDLKKWAGDIGLNTAQFNSCLDSSKYKENVTNDQADGQKASVDGTPSFFVNGNRLVGAQPFSAFQTAIDAQLK